jgi:tetratricopeptide (TPR) repeat protein
MRQFDNAIRDYDQAIKLRPDYAEALYNRGFAKKANGDMSGGDTDIAAARKINPDIGK